MDRSLDDLEADLHRKARRRRIILGAVAVLAVGSVVAPCLYMMGAVGSSMRESAERRVEHSQVATPDQIAAVDAALEAFEAELPDRAARWQATMVDASRVVPDTSRVCAHRLPVRQPSEAARGGSFNNLDSFTAFVFPGRQGFPHAIVRGSLPHEPPRVEHARERARQLRERIRETGRTEDLAALAEQARGLARSFWSYDVVVFAETYQPPTTDALGTSFTPGHLRGRAVLYDYASDSIACAGDVEASTTSQAVDYSAQMFHERQALQSMLSTEMDAEVERAIARSMRFGASVADRALAD